MRVNHPNNCHFFKLYNMLLSAVISFSFVPKFLTLSRRTRQIHVPAPARPRAPKPHNRAGDGKMPVCRYSEPRTPICETARGRRMLCAHIRTQRHYALGVVSLVDISMSDIDFRAHFNSTLADCVRQFALNWVCDR